MRVYKIICLLLLVGCRLNAQVKDTTIFLTNLAANLKGCTNTSYDYVIDARFPNGNKDRLSGTASYSKERKIYYNNCPAYTMLYTAEWYYYADHRGKTVALISQIRKQKKGDPIMGSIFTQEYISALLDSSVLHNAVIKKATTQGKIYRISLLLPRLQNARVEIAYEVESMQLLECNLSLSQVWYKHADEEQTIDYMVKLSHFQSVSDWAQYDPDLFFKVKGKKAELIKYNNYKLTTNI